MLHEGSMCLYQSGSGPAEAHGILLWPRKLRICPGFGWNAETIDNFYQLKAKIRNNYQSSATVAIPYTVICMWARWLILPEERQKERLQQSKAAEVCLEKHTGVWETSAISWDQLFPSYLEINKPWTKLYELLIFCFMVLVLFCIQLLLTRYLLFIKYLL